VPDHVSHFTQYISRSCLALAHNITQRILFCSRRRLSGCTRARSCDRQGTITWSANSAVLDLIVCMWRENDEQSAPELILKMTRRFSLPKSVRRATRCPDQQPSTHQSQASAREGRQKPTCDAERRRDRYGLRGPSSSSMTRRRRFLLDALFILFSVCFLHDSMWRCVGRRVR
jgi:hypothetical protein